MNNILSFIAISIIGISAFAADYETEVQQLIPKLADSNVPSRYAAQMELQDLASKSSTPGNAAERESLGKVFAAKIVDESIPQPARVWMVRQLEYMGGAEAVASLAALLQNNDPELKECGRRALEKNSAANASDSLRAALEKASDDAWKIGLMNSLGQRKDAQSVALIKNNLANSKLAGPAALALGKIGSAEAITALQDSIAQNPMSAQALVDVANNQLARGNKESAGNLYQFVYQKAAVSAMKGAALISMVKLNAKGAGELLSAALTGSDSKLQHAAVAALPYADASTKVQMRGLLPQLAPAIKAQLIATFDASSEALVIGAAGDAEEVVRLAALETLGKIGSAAAVPVLIKAAASEVRNERVAAETALARISGNGALAAIEKSATEGYAKARIAAVNTIVAKQHNAALPSLVAIAQESDDTVKNAALAAIGKLGSDKEVEPLARIILSTKNDDAATALEKVVTRVKDRSSASQTLFGLVKSDDDLASFLTPIAVLGGAENLKKVTSLLSGKYDEKAVIALGNWSDMSAIKPILGIMQDANMPEKRVSLALQSALRLMENIEATGQDATEVASLKVEAAKAAIKVAKTTDAKKQVLAAVGSVPHPDIVEWVKSLLADSQLKVEAGLAGAMLAENLLNVNRQAAKELATQLRDANISREVTRRANAVLRK